MTKSFPRSPATQPPSGVVGDTLSGASANAETGSHPAGQAQGLGASRFDPARIADLTAVGLAAAKWLDYLWDDGAGDAHLEGRLFSNLESAVAKARQSGAIK